MTVGKSKVMWEPDDCHHLFRNIVYVRDDYLGSNYSTLEVI